MEKRCIAYVGNVNRFDYEDVIEFAKENGVKTYDLMNTSDEQKTQDLLEAKSLVVIGEWWEIPKDARDIIGLAQIIGKPVRCLNDVPGGFRKMCIVNFCTELADSILFAEGTSELGEDD